MADTVSKSWFCVFNNPADHGYDGTPEEICERFADEWMDKHPAGACAVTYCISADGLHHLHAVLEDQKALRFSAVKKVYPSMHIESTKGSKEQAEDYILKRGSFAEKDEKILHFVQRGEIKGSQGKRRDIEVIGDCIDKGMSPSQILDLSFQYRRYETMIRKAYFDKRKKETPWFRPVLVYWHVGEPESGKSRVSGRLVEEFGEDDLYLVAEYDHPFDGYEGQRILFLDEFKCQFKFSTLLSLLDGYKIQVSARYSNVYALWTEVHITSVFSPEEVYKKMVEQDRDRDSIKQLWRRINYVVYHWTEKGEFCEFKQSMKDYLSYGFLKQAAMSDENGFMKVPDDEPIFGDI